ncbi:2-heptaprenyl-1,4-naphthoquinone methyltransferase [Methanocella sp. CWC-04]|uniref:2-heptaprenyl-1,4-naphthoquinone methyltransferase n=1 Tax=Methanooceanicella nereidis TaxID=2052831 RepID=A0AAP2RAY6_9EURY|nr:methyltransferase domain-containing protein [Methanocella sp. CWC-04]MCD1293814.1 2-heptaprenyl-1,4-naphthoquinone methyltransferase [Methanocella sp. CWC-04]
MSSIDPGISRVSRPKKDAIKSYDLMSGLYDALAGSSEKKFRDAGLNKLGVKDGDSILEIGPGTGQSLISMATSAGENGKVYGLDISGAMCRKSRERAKNSGVMQRVTLTRGDASRLPYKDGSFDAIFMSFVLELFDTPDIPVMLQECKRVLRAGGRICVVGTSKGDKDNLALKLYEAAHRLLPAYVDCRPIYVERSLRAAGFQVTDMTMMSMFGLPVEVVLAMSENAAGPV